MDDPTYEAVDAGRRPVCDRCDREMDLVPAGFSRAKQKPYPAFYSCDSRKGGCGNKKSAGGDQRGSAPHQVPNGIDKETAVRIEEKLDRIIRILTEGV